MIKKYFANMESHKENSFSISHAEFDQIQEKLSELLLTLPKHDLGDPWLTMYQYQGFWYRLMFLNGLVSLHKNEPFFQALPTDIIIAGGFKSGNTWLKSFCLSISMRHQFPDFDSSPLLRHVSHNLVPFLDVELAMNLCSRHPDHPLISTHLPYPALPESILSSGAKIVYICREPKDTFVSQHHFVVKIEKKMGVADRTSESLTEADVDLFCQGISPWGPYWDHVLGYYKAHLDNPDKILFLKFEDLKRDTLFYVKKLAEFIGFPFSDEEERQGLPEKIVKFCSFRNLSGLEVNKTGKHLDIIDNNFYFRKGEMGDWKNHLFEEMAEKFDRVTDEKFNGYDFKFGSTGTTPP